MSTLFIGNNTIRLPIVGSTNGFAQELVKKESVPEGTIIIANEQSQGRGQRGNTWLSEAGKNLTFSLILHPTSLSADNQFLLTQTISLALVDFIENEIGDKHQIKIKWPNDILAGNKKIAGILIENSLRGTEISSSIIGIGINIQQENFENLGATSLQLLSPKKYDLQNCLDSLCSLLEARYLQLLSRNKEELKKSYLKKLYRLNEEALYEIAGKKLYGKIIGVDASGKLLLALTENFKVLELNFKEIKFIL